MKLRLVALAAVVVAVVSGCTANLAHRLPTPSAAPAKPAVAAIAQAWSAQPGDRWSPRIASSTAPALWMTATAFVVPGRQSLTSYSSTTGARQWTVRLPEPVCTIAPGPNSAGIGAVMMGSAGLADAGGCGRAGAVDLHTGRLLWTTSVKGLSYYGLTAVAVGRSAVVATSPCDTAVTIAVRTGKVLVKLPAKAGKDCSNNWASDGTTLVAGQKFDPRGGLVGYDVVSGRRLWTVRSHTDAAHRTALTTVHRVVSSDPLVVEASINQHRFLRIINPKAGTATPFGREGSNNGVSSIERSSDHRLVVQYSGSRVLFTYDPRTGAQLGRVVLDAHEQTGGLRDGAVITVDTGDNAIGAGHLVVRTTDAATGAQRVLGVLSSNDITGLFNASSMSGNYLIVGADAAVEGFRLPASGPLASSFPDPAPWRSGDIRPNQAVDLCTGITAATTRAFGFALPTHAAPADCGWVETTASNQVVQLSVQSNVSVPIATSPAIQDAHSLFVRLAKPDGVNQGPVMTPVSGLGDEAQMSVKSAPSPTVTIVVRRANVVMTLFAFSDSYDQNDTKVFAQLQRALRLAAQDVVAELDRRR